ncbi:MULTISPECIES: GbsR/MarR family transcriptional regulator [unclassified Salinivibrio]|uniref:GbsR/MarR family transcriptional regulator n=1 Tax=unclassified Salinivibrio TaxID=2636825 RepID=UPI00128C0E18|nr:MULTISPECIES: MarR family transcriptional regulator [unclassified Salinivibrio]MPS31959.1 transcriptional regulator [Salinivibrio sp. VYel7]MPX89766.1 transcriptional regulator [Salinivibrio sp. VYel1]MPX93353.1 transcriptional regulator [Salinivibrio sp. VYel9]MPX95820.1 transcriptional regulator [Salinivibrio sp. VYel6]MPX99571.1 transcriptional regulator [Salinivibrio sp. VYel4]
MELSQELRNVVMHFGEMGSRWGFNRSVGEMLALIVLSEHPLSADDIVSALNISRGNVSMATKELQGWHLIRSQRTPGDRKDYFVSNGTIWELAQQVLAERKKREVDPTLSMLRSHFMRSEDDAESHSVKQLHEIHDLLELFNHWFDDVQQMKPEHLKNLMKLGSSVGKLLELSGKLFHSKSNEESGS